VAGRRMMEQEGKVMGCARGFRAAGAPMVVVAPTGTPYSRKARWGRCAARDKAIQRPDRRRNPAASPVCWLCHVRPDA